MGGTLPPKARRPEDVMLLKKKRANWLLGQDANKAFDCRQLYISDCLHMKPAQFENGEDFETVDVENKTLTGTF